MVLFTFWPIRAAVPWLVEGIHLVCVGKAWEHRKRWRRCCLRWFIFKSSNLLLSIQLSNRTNSTLNWFNFNVSLIKIVKIVRQHVYALWANSLIKYCFVNFVLNRKRLHWIQARCVFITFFYSKSFIYSYHRSVWDVRNVVILWKQAAIVPLMITTTLSLSVHRPGPGAAVTF